jgi:nucleoid-associated protein YgaU
MSVVQRLVLIVPLMLGPAALAADSNPDAPDRASEVLEILTRSKKIAEQEKTGDKSAEKPADKSAEKAPEKPADKTPAKTEPKPVERPVIRTGEPDGDAAVDHVQQVLVTPPSTGAPPTEPATKPADAPKTQTPVMPVTPSTPPASNQPLLIAPRPATPAAPATSGPTQYTIQSGDTFSSIALHLYDDEKKWTAIAQANPLVDPARLKVGQVIRLPDLAQFHKQREQQLDEIKAAVARPAAESKTVMVQPGDTLSHIARRVYGSAGLWDTIFQANRDQLETPDKLKVGMKLVIPPKPQ